MSNSKSRAAQPQSMILIEADGSRIEVLHTHDTDLTRNSSLETPSLKIQQFQQRLAMGLGLEPNIQELGTEK
jgi:hypothetical protein